MWVRVLFAFLDYHVYFVFKFSLNKFSLSLLERKLAPNYREEFHPGKQPQRSPQNNGVAEKNTVFISIMLILTRYILR